MSFRKEVRGEHGGKLLQTIDYLYGTPILPREKKKEKNS